MSYARIILVSAGLLIAVGSAARYVVDGREARAARGWPAVEGRITSSRVGEEVRYISSGTRMTRIRQYKPSITYRYSAGGQERSGSRIWSDGVRVWDDRTGAEAFAAEYPLFATVPVYHDPADPERAHLVVARPSIGWLLIALFGALLTWFGSYARGRPKRRSKPSPDAAG